MCFMLTVRDTIFGERAHAAERFYSHNFIQPRTLFLVNRFCAEAFSLDLGEWVLTRPVTIVK